MREPVTTTVSRLESWAWAGAAKPMAATLAVASISARALLFVRMALVEVTFVSDITFITESP
jgi:hypothetical protein